MGHKPYFPVFVDLSGKKTVVAGTGKDACEMIRTLLMFTDNITVIAPGADPEDLADLEKAGKIHVLRKAYEREDIFDADLVIAALESEKENSDIYAACRCLGIAVYVCGSRSKQDFIIPEITRRGSLTAGICDDRRDAAAEKSLAQRIRDMETK